MTWLEVMRHAFANQFKRSNWNNYWTWNGDEWVYTTMSRAPDEPAGIDEMSPTDFMADDFELRKW